ncbi:MAG: glycoside hydrolase family 78 protein [Actinomycetales bacterium]|nr:glycoside hydrolase family 78 protein [Actinomycetales bacterium]
MSRVVGVRAELRRDAFGLGTARPRLSWQVEDADGLEQVGAEVRALGVGAVRLAELDGDEQVLVRWPFEPLASRERVTVAVRVRLSDGTWTRWSDELGIEAALLDPRDWREPLVVPSAGAGHELRPSYLLRARFEVPAGVVSARLYATAHGVFQAYLNGERVGDEVLAPGWTSYSHRLRYRVHDVTSLLASGSNVVGVELADGWFRGRIGFEGGLWDVYGKHVGALLQLEVTDEAGLTTVVPLSELWRCATGPSVAVGLYEGETYDARRLPPGWLDPDFDDHGWAVPETRPVGLIAATLEAAVNEPVRVVEALAPVRVQRRPNGRIRLDFGQNVSGVLRIRVDLPAGRQVSLHHAEVLEGDELGIRPLRQAPSVDTFVADGRGVTTWQPRFTIHGFRYAELEGWDGTPGSGDVEALVIHTDMERRGWFECSDPLVNQLHENTVWSMRDNFVDLPTDCPQRDERLGWTGDIQVFAPAAEFLYGADGVLASWLRDVAAEQGPGGAVPNFVPWLDCGFPSESSAAWGDAAVIVPSVMYQRRGDVGVLAAQWPSMTAWVDHLADRIGPRGVVAGSMELGDWLDPAAPPDDPAAARTDKYLVATAHLVHSGRLVAQAGRVLGHEAEAERYEALAAATADAARRVWFAEPERLAHSPTALALGIEFGIVGPEARVVLGDLLSEAVREAGHTIATGFVGTPLICDALASTGHLDDAYGLLLQTECPSWLYPVTMGATTIWERWDSMMPDGTINPGEMTSFNHYALGAVVDFLHRVVAGLAPAAPGYRRVEVRPRLGGGLTSARARHLSPYGPIEVEWELDADLFTLHVDLPSGVTGTVVLPRDDEPVRIIGPGRSSFACLVDQGVDVPVRSRIDDGS